MILRETSAYHIENLMDINPDAQVVELTVAERLEQENAGLKAEIERLKLFDVRQILNDVNYSHNGIACGIEERDIVEVNEAAEYGFNECLDQIGFQIEHADKIEAGE